MMSSIILKNSNKKSPQSFTDGLLEQVGKKLENFSVWKIRHRNGFLILVRTFFNVTCWLKFLQQAISCQQTFQEIHRRQWKCVSLYLQSQVFQWQKLCRRHQ